MATLKKDEAKKGFELIIDGVPVADGVRIKEVDLDAPPIRIVGLPFEGELVISDVNAADLSGYVKKRLKEWFEEVCEGSPFLPPVLEPAPFRLCPQDVDDMDAAFKAFHTEHDAGPCVLTFTVDECCHVVPGTISVRPDGDESATEEAAEADEKGEEASDVEA